MKSLPARITNAQDEEPGIPNLDDPEADLDYYAYVFRLLEGFCNDKREAIRARKEGRIQKAIALESRLEAIYSRLPAWAKW